VRKRPPWKKDASGERTPREVFRGPLEGGGREGEKTTCWLRLSRPRSSKRGPGKEGLVARPVSRFPRVASMESPLNCPHPGSKGLSHRSSGNPTFSVPPRNGVFPLPAYRSSLLERRICRPVEAGEAAAPAPGGGGGKSGLRRAGWWLTATVRKDRESATETTPPKGSRLRPRPPARVKWRGKSSPRGRRRSRQGKPHPEKG